jgi:outer membrane protein TolC
MIIRRFAILICLFVLSATLGFAQESQNPLLQSVPSGAASSTPLSLGVKDAIDRAIKNNLAAVYGTEAERIAAAQRLGDLAELLPKLEARLSTEQRQINLAAFGFGGFPGVRQVIGPFALVDARAYFTQPLVDLERRHNLKESTETQRAAALSSMNTREMVVLTVVDLYFQVVSEESRVRAVDAQLTRAKALFGRATDLKNAGYVAGIDVVRAEVEQRSMEQRLIQAKNSVRKEKLALAKAIGLPLAQEFTLADQLPAETAANYPLSEMLERAFANRSDAKAVDAQVRAAEEAVKAVKSRSLPTLNANGDYGAIGRSPGQSHGTYSLRLEVRVPIFDRENQSDAFEKESNLRKRQAERDSLHSRIEYEVRSTLLDIQSTAEQLGVARRSLVLARQQLDQAQDRFGAGVTDNLEVVQAQESVALADEAVIQSLYEFNISRALLARATGTAERSIQEAFLGSSSK